MNRRLLLLVVALASPCWNGLRADEASPPPDGWRSYTVRSEIAPRFWVESLKEKAAPRAYALGLAGRGDEAVDGRWLRSLPVTAGKHYVFHAEYRAKNVATLARSVLARVIWLDAKGKQISQAEFPLTKPDRTPDGWTAVTGTYQAPTQTAQAQIELHLRWAAHGFGKATQAANVGALTSAIAPFPKLRIPVTYCLGDLGHRFPEAVKQHPLFRNCQVILSRPTPDGTVASGQTVKSVTHGVKQAPHRPGTARRSVCAREWSP